MKKIQRLHAVLLTEFLNTTSSVQNFLFASIERVAKRADFDVEVFAYGCACLELVAAAASYVYFRVIRMDIGLHADVSFKSCRRKPVIINETDEFFNS